MFVNNYVQGPIIRGVATSVDDMQKFKIEESFSTLNKILEHQNWVAGDHLTVADISIMVTVDTAEVKLFLNLYLHFKHIKDILFLIREIPCISLLISRDCDLFYVVYNRGFLIVNTFQTINLIQLSM